MHTLLLFPPPGDIAQPYVALPALTAALRSDGRTVRQRDLNPEYLAWLQRPQVYAALLRRVWARAQDPNDTTEGWNDPRRALLLNDEDPAGVAAAVATLKDAARYYDPETFAAARRRLRSLYRLASAAHHPYELDLFRFAPPVDPLLPVGAVLDLLRHPEGSPWHDFFNDAVLPALDDPDLGLLGLSVTYGQQLLPALHLASLARQRRPGLTVAMGGAALTGYHRTFAAHPELFELVDGVVIGDGETALLELVDRVERGTSLRGVPNLLRRDTTGTVCSGPRHEEDLSSHATPDYRGLPLDAYVVPEVTLLVPVSRGCTWGRCTFCNFDALRCSYRERPAEAAAQDVARLVAEHGTRSFYFTGNTVRPRSLRALAEALIEAQQDIRWVVELRLDRGHRPANFVTLHEAGCRFVMFGVESASQAVQDRMNKGYKVEQFEPVLRGAAQAGLRVGVEAFIGFPGETPTQARETAAYLRAHREHIAFFTLGTFVLDPNSIVARDPAHYGVRVLLHQQGLAPQDCFPRFVPFERTDPDAPTEADTQALNRELYAELQADFPYTLERFGQGIGGPDPTLYAIHYPTSFFHSRPEAPPAPPLRSSRDLAGRIPCWAPAVQPRRLRADPFDSRSAHAPAAADGPHCLVVREADGAYLALAPAVWPLLAAVDGERSVMDVVASSGLSTRDAVEALLALSDEGYLRLLPSSAGERAE